jgi:hypothetical protein
VKYKIIVALALSLQANAMPMFDHAMVKAPSRLGHIKVYHDNGKFQVLRNGRLTDVNSYDVHPSLRTMSKNGLIDKKIHCGLIVVGTIGEKGNLYYTITAYAKAKW